MSPNPDPQVATQDRLIDATYAWFQRAYSEHWTPGGDEQDHYEATHAAIEAVVVALTGLEPCPYCDPGSPGFQRTDSSGYAVVHCSCDLGFYEPAALDSLRREDPSRLTPEDAQLITRAFIVGVPQGTAWDDVWKKLRALADEKEPLRASKEGR